MPIGNLHNYYGGILCECQAHKEARAAGVKAHKISVEMLKIAKQNINDPRLEKMYEELAVQNRIARQCEK